jgi:hypothetical protein
MRQWRSISLWWPFRRQLWGHVVKERVQDRLFAVGNGDNLEEEAERPD